MTENIDKILKKHSEEVKRHFNVVAEDIKDDIKAVAEQVVANTEKLEEHSQRFDRVEDTLEIIKLDIEFIKNELKRKVSWDEFVALEKRVSMLEVKQK